jgi:acetyl-CoA carboxylase biotin carboxyl carrier protein
MANEITNDDIREFVKLAVDSGVAEIEVQRGENRVRIRRTPKAVVQTHAVHPLISTAGEQPNNTQPGPGGSSATAGHAAAPAQAAQPAAPASTDVIVKSPIVGTYYDQAKPGDPPFVKVGDTVEPGQVLCIIESMKLMNEIEAEIAGTIVAKLVDNGKPVEYGESLFTIRPR